MTNPELIARLRKADEYEPLGHDGWEAADRIEALIAEQSNLVVAAHRQGYDQARAVSSELRRAMAERIMEHEAKLASSEATLLENEVRLRKAVEIGNKMAHSIEGNYYLPNIAGEWRKVAAEISSEAALNKGESHE